MTLADVDSHNARIARGKKPIEPSAEGCDDESELHRQILDECKRRRFYVIHSRMDKRTTTQAGVPDFVLAMPDGKTVFVEAKRRNGKLSADQTVTRHVLLALGHRYACVFNYEQFLKAIEL